MVVADDKVDAQLLGVGYLLYGLDAAVQYDDELDIGLLGVFYAFAADSVPLFLTVGDVVVDIGVELLQELVDQCYCGTAVDVIVAVYHNALFTPHGIVQTVYR